MPWMIKPNSSSCPADKPVGVHKKNADGSAGPLVGCHMNEESAKKQMAALYANEPSASAKTPPTDSLLRIHAGYDGASLRATEDGNGRTLFGHFAVFNQWTEINSMFEGQFLERVAPGAFADTIRSKGTAVKVLYDHGTDPQVGNKPLGSIRTLREDPTGAYYEVDLIDTPYNRDFVIPAARAGLLGASFRFRITSEAWNETPAVSDYNPDRLPERTITGTELYEFGPVTFPAYQGATAGVRSGTDWFIDKLSTNDLFVARFIERVGPTVVQRIVAGLPTATPTTSSPEPTALEDKPDTGEVATATTADGGETWNPKQRRLQWLAAHVYS